MDYKLNVGLSAGFILGAIGFMIGASQWVGIALFSLAAVWIFLFVNPWSPVRKYWWSASDKLVIVNVQYAGSNAKANSKYISVYAELRPRSSIWVDRIDIKIKGKGIEGFDWKPHEVSTYETMLVSYERPDWLHAGKYEYKLIARTPEGISKSGKFKLEVTDE